MNEGLLQGSRFGDLNVQVWVVTAETAIDQTRPFPVGQRMTAPNRSRRSVCRSFHAIRSAIRHHIIHDLFYFAIPFGEAERLYFVDDDLVRRWLGDE